ncbi:hypothetical protein EVAR_3338_1 [Eumeta japonica]|uniref:Uncharacterized protein n=1 Tax=Eumeta variegata TaxID=151549 RepID=A0A4C1SUS6_EUMVA|nr:hypothetical protein EVAR_3338_1 [Eumeta japonica]
MALQKHRPPFVKRNVAGNRTSLTGNTTLHTERHRFRRQVRWIFSGLLKYADVPQFFVTAEIKILSSTEYLASPENFCLACPVRPHVMILTVAHDIIRVWQKKHESSSNALGMRYLRNVSLDRYSCGDVTKRCNVKGEEPSRVLKIRVWPSRLCAAAVSLLLGRIGRRSGRDIARSMLSLALARLKRNATMSHAFSCVQPAFIDL